jgi:hypothetical protein
MDVLVIRRRHNALELHCIVPDPKLCSDKTLIICTLQLDIAMFSNIHTC